MRFILSNFSNVFLISQVKLSSYDQQALSAEEQSRSVQLAVTQHKFSPWTWMWNEKESLVPRMMNSTPMSTFSPMYDIPVQEIQLPVSADGVMSFQVQLSDSVATLDIEVRTLHFSLVEVFKLARSRALSSASS